MACLMLVPALVAAAAVPEAGAGPAPPTPQFEGDVVPILRAYCWKCHGGEGRAGGLDLRSLPLVLAGGKSGPAIERGNADASLLIKKLESGEMPPASELKPTASHLATLRAWAAGGAPAAYEGGPLSADDSPPISDRDRQAWAFRTPISLRCCRRCKARTVCAGRLTPSWCRSWRLAA